MEDNKIKSSGLTKFLESAACFAVKFATTWDYSPVLKKEALQKLVFPEVFIKFCFFSIVKPGTGFRGK